MRVCLHGSMNKRKLDIHVFWFDSAYMDTEIFVYACRRSCAASLCFRFLIRDGLMRDRLAIEIPTHSGSWAIQGPWRPLFSCFAFADSGGDTHASVPRNVL